MHPLKIIYFQLSSLDDLHYYNFLYGMNKEKNEEGPRANSEKLKN